MGRVLETFDSIALEGQVDGSQKVTMLRSGRERSFTVSGIQKAEITEWGLELETSDGKAIVLQLYVPLSTLV